MEIVILKNELKYSRLFSAELKAEQIKDAANETALVAKTLYQKVCQKHNEIPDDIDIVSFIQNTETTVMCDDVTEENVSIIFVCCQRVIRNDIDYMCDTNNHTERTIYYKSILYNIKHAYDYQWQLHGKNVIKRVYP